MAFSPIPGNGEHYTQYIRVTDMSHIFHFSTLPIFVECISYSQALGLQWDWIGIAAIFYPISQFCN